MDTVYAPDAVPKAVLDQMSPATRHALAAYISAGNPSHRRQKVDELLRRLAWLTPVEDPGRVLASPDLRPLMAALGPQAGAQLLNDARTLRQQRVEARQRRSEQRQDLKRRVIDYYRQRLSREDKLLLEALRDYELDLTGRDANWQHHFSLTSFKRIDAFATATSQARSEWIDLFKADVAAYARNKDRWQQTDAACGDFNFDDWCDWMGPQVEVRPGQRRTTTAGSALGGLTAPILRAYQTLELPPDAPLDTIKRRFRALTLTYHPDRPTGNAEKMKRVLAAYDTLKAHLGRSAS